MKWFRNKKEKNENPSFDYMEAYRSSRELNHKLESEINQLSKELVWWKEKAMNFKKHHQ